MSWRVHEQVGPDHTVHTWPENDIRQHRTAAGAEPCWCEPRLIEYWNGNVQVVHRDELDRLMAD